MCIYIKLLYIYIYTVSQLYIFNVILIAVAQLSINGTNVTSVTDTTNEPQYHVKEDEGSITLCIRLESFPEEKDNLTINYSTAEGTACKSTCCYVRFGMILVLFLFSGWKRLSFNTCN